ncbi:MAG: LolA family protein [Terracidiphilus sp.]
MTAQRKLVFALPLLALLLPARSSFAASDLKSVLHQLDVAAAQFRTASASFKFDNIQTEPVPDTDVWTGTVYYKHSESEFEMAAHVAQRDGQQYPAIYNYTHGIFQLYDKNQNHVTRYSNAANLGGYVMLGFGASGKDLESKFNVTYLGQETIDGVATDKLQMIPKDPQALRFFSKVTIWIDPTRDVNLKQVFDEGDGLSRVCTYTNIKVNEPVSSAEFTLKTDRKTTFSNQ